MAINFTAARGSPSTTITCTDTSSYGAIVVWSWILTDPVGGQHTSFLQNPVFTGIQSGAFTVTLLIFNTLGQSAHLLQSYSGLGVSAGVAGFTLSTFPQVIGSPVTATDASSGSPTSRQWTGQFSSSHYGNVTAITDPAAVAFYELDDNYSTGIGTVSYEINYAKISVPGSANVGDSVNFTFSIDTSHYALSTPPSTTYLWDFGDGNTASGNFTSGTAANISHTYSSYGIKTVTFTLACGGTNDLILSQNISINVPISAAFSVTGAGSSPSTPQFVGSNVTFTDQSTGFPAPSSWLWDFGDGNTSTSQNPTHPYSTHGTYTVSLTVS